MEEAFLSNFKITNFIVFLFHSVPCADRANHIETDIARATLSCLPNAKIKILKK